MSQETTENLNNLPPESASLPYPGDAMMQDLLQRMGIARTMLELRAITLGFLAGYRNPQNTPDLFYTLIRGGKDILDQDPVLLGEYTRALLGMKNQTAAWDVTTELTELATVAGEDPIQYLNRRLAEADLFTGLMLDGREENLAYYTEKTQQNYASLLQVMAQMEALKTAVQSGEMPKGPEVLELLESYGRELWSIMIFLKRSEAGEFLERKLPNIAPFLSNG